MSHKLMYVYGKIFTNYVTVQNILKLKHTKLALSTDFIYGARVGKINKTLFMLLVCLIRFIFVPMTYILFTCIYIYILFRAYLLYVMRTF